MTKLTGKLVTMELTTEGFCVASTQDSVNEPRIINHGGQRNLAKFTAWFKSNRELLETMSLSDVQSALDANGIDYHSQYPVDESTRDSWRQLAAELLRLTGQAAG